MTEDAKNQLMLDALNLISRVGALSVPEMVSLVPGMSKQIAWRMSETKLIASVPRDDGTSGYAISRHGRQLIGLERAPGRRTPGRLLVSGGHYTGAELKPFTGRPGANDHERHPSRMGDDLAYRGGGLAEHPDKTKS